MRIGLLFLFILICTKSQSQEFRDESILRIEKAEISKIHLHNYRGTVEIVGSKGDQIVLEIQRILKSASNERMEDAKVQIHYDSMHVGNDLYLFIQDPERAFRINLNGEGEYETCYLNFVSNEERYQVKYEFNLKLTVPESLNLSASNHEKALTVSGVKGVMQLNDHHDGITVSGASDNVEVHSHHGDIEVEFTKNPPDYIKASTHHGDIKIELAPEFSADVALKSRHGSFYTEYDWQPLPTLVSRVEEENRIKYKVGEFTRVRIGSGKIDAQFETYHGDIIIEENN